MAAAIETPPPSAVNGSGSKLSRIISRFTSPSLRSSPSSTSLNAQHTSDDEEEDVLQEPEFVSDFMKKQKRHSLESPQSTTFAAKLHRKRPNSISSDTELDMDNTVSPLSSRLKRGIDCLSKMDQNRASSLEPRPSLTRQQSAENTTLTNNAASFHAKSTPGPSTVSIGAGLNESSKRFRSAFRMKARVTAEGHASSRKAGRARLTDPHMSDSVENSESDRSPEFESSRGHYSSASPEDVQLANQLNKVSLENRTDSVSMVKRKTSTNTLNNQSSSTVIPPQVEDLSLLTNRALFNSSRLQSRLEAASLLPASNSLPDLSIDTRRTSPSTNLHSQSKVVIPIVREKKASPPPLSSRASPVLSALVAANKNASRNVSQDDMLSHDRLSSLKESGKATSIDKEGSPTEQRRLPALDSRSGRPTSDTFKLVNGNNRPLHAQASSSPTPPSHDAENMPVQHSHHLKKDALGMKLKEKPMPLANKSSFFSTAPAQQQPVSSQISSAGYRKPLLDVIPPQEQHASSNAVRSAHSSGGSSGPLPSDRMVPLKQSSVSPPEHYNHHPHHQPSQFSVLPDLPPNSQPFPVSSTANAYAQSVRVNQVPPLQQMLPQPQASTSSARKATHVTVNGKQYLKSALLGKGGSSRVYRITDREHNVFALKRVELGKGDLETYTSFCNEIELLKRLKGHDRIIQLIDEEVNEAKRTLVMILEIGEIDLNSLLQEKVGKRVSMNFIRQTWEQMLEAVKVVHDAGIVHTDLKPANFVLVKGALKLIDFGIAKAIPSDTTNIARDQQIGTANYMSPEALCDSGMGARGERLMKMGRPSDVWSLGCILYQMVYGSTPFGKLRNLQQKMIAIQNPLYQIDFPSHAIPKTKEGIELPDLAVRVEGDLLRCLKHCLLFESKKRSTIPELLEDRFLRREGSETIRKEATLSPNLVAHLVKQTLEWSYGRQPSRSEQDRYIDSLFRQLSSYAEIENR